MNNIKLDKGVTESIFNSTTIFIIIVAMLCGIGLIAIYSSSLYDEHPVFQRVVGRQVLWIVFGVTVAIALSFAQRRWIFDYPYLLYFLGFILLILPFILGPNSTGTYRWLNFGVINFQPSEVMKIFVVLCIAKYLSNPNVKTASFKTVLVVFFISLLPMIVVLNQPDLGTASIYFAIIFPILFLGGARVFHIFVLLSPLISIFAAFNFYMFFIWILIILLVLRLSKEKLWVWITILIFNVAIGLAAPEIWDGLKPYQQKRILTFFNVELDPQGTGYQMIQSQITIGSGGISGKGFCKGTQTHLKFLPEQHSDFIFSVIGEEFGFLGSVFTLLLFLSLITILFRSSFRMNDGFGSLVTIGIGSILFFHTVMNIGMVVGIFPVTGVPLPFLSYGGSFMLTCFIMVGLFLNFNKRRYR